MTGGTTRSAPPRIGDILHYVYLFERERALRDEGIKTRPVVVIDVEPATNCVAVVPVTTKGDAASGALPLPAEVAAAAGLARNSSVLVSEYNMFTWLGFDIRPVVNGWIAGRLPPGFTAKLRNAAISGGVPVDRD